MTVQDVTAESVLAAIAEAGSADVFVLAERFGVLHSSHTLRSTLAGLRDAGLVRVASTRGDGTKVFEAVA